MLSADAAGWNKEVGEDKRRRIWNKKVMKSKSEINWNKNSRKTTTWDGLASVEAAER